MGHNPGRVKGWMAVLLLAAAAGLALFGRQAVGHIVPPEQYHPVAESERRLAFVLALNPVRWDLVESDAGVIATALAGVDVDAGATYRAHVEDDVRRAREASAGEGLDPQLRRELARDVFVRSTRAAGRILADHLRAAQASLDSYADASRDLEAARGVWATFEHEVRYTDPDAFREIGRAWLGLSHALGAPGVLGAGVVEPDREAFATEAAKITSYVEANFGEAFTVEPGQRLLPLPRASLTFDPAAAIPVKLPPGSNVNKQLPRPRQVLNMATRGVNESETPLIALGDMAFDSPYIFGEPAQSIGLSCNTCHNKSITNPQFFVPGISRVAGGLDVSNSFFAGHANNGHFDPLDIPDLRGIRFTAPYGRNGRFPSLRDFVRNVIVNEFNGPEPDPMILDGIVAYMLEFDFLPNPYLNADGTLNEKAPAAALRGQELFNRPFASMGGRACASCHVPSDQFVDRRSHDVGTVAGTGEGSRDRSLDTPTLLSSRYTAPYFHDGRAPTLQSAVEWFDEHYALGLSKQQIEDLTTYVETVGAGEQPYEDTMHTLEAEMEEFSFFLSTYEFLRGRGRADLNELTFQTIASEIRAHKWDVQDQGYLPVLERLAELMDEAYAASRAGEESRVDELVAQYRDLYEGNAEVLQ